MQVRNVIQLFWNDFPALKATENLCARLFVWLTDLSFQHMV